MSFVTSLLISAQLPPPTHPSWCADAKQSLSVNGTVRQSTTFRLCLDSTPGSLRWSSNVTGILQVFNGTTRFDLTPNSSAPGGVSCVATYFGPAISTQMPWSFIRIDDDSAFNRTEHDVDGFEDVNVWSKYRPEQMEPIRIPAQLMEWRIENTSQGAKKEFLSSSCIQAAFPPSPPGLMQDGTRDFSHNYVTPAPESSFSAPSGSHCVPAPGSEPWVPDDGCKPACPTGALCCRDPHSAPPGYCMSVTSCAEIHGGPSTQSLMTAAWPKLSSPVESPSKSEVCKGFVPAMSCSTQHWVGVWKDLFSPDDTCPNSTRYIELGDTSQYNFDGKLHISASGTDAGCTSTWGRKFDRATSVDPQLTPLSGAACAATVSFESKVPKEAPVRKFVDQGALNFTITLGTFQGRAGFIKFNGLYNGAGGPWLDDQGRLVDVPPAACDNFWESLRR